MNTPYNLAAAFVVSLQMSAGAGNQAHHVFNLFGEQIPRNIFVEKKRKENFRSQIPGAEETHRSH